MPKQNCASLGVHPRNLRATWEQLLEYGPKPARNADVKARRSNKIPFHDESAKPPRFVSLRGFSRSVSSRAYGPKPDAKALDESPNARSHHDRRLFLALGRSLGSVQVDVDASEFLSICIKQRDLPLVMFSAAILVDWLFLSLGHARLSSHVHFKPRQLCRIYLPHEMGHIPFSIVAQSAIWKSQCRW